MPASWDFHLVDGRTEVSCSDACREYGDYAARDGRSAVQEVQL